MAMDHESLYTQLTSPRSFRLLRVIDTRESDDSESPVLACCLDVFTLDSECPEYVALSYTWGAPRGGPGQEAYSEENLEPINVSHDGRSPREQHIRKNLYNALCILRAKHTGSLVWVDALCINQDDAAEKASQIQLMGDIYSESTCTVAWLGPELKHMDHLLWWYGPFIEHLSRRISTVSHDGTPATVLPLATIAHDPSSEESVLALDDGEVTVIITDTRLRVLCRWFEQSRYFTRTWVFQELVLPRKVQYMLGLHELCTTEEGDPLDLHTILYMWLSHNLRVVRLFYSNREHTGGKKWATFVPAPPVTPAVWLARKRKESKTLDLANLFGAVHGESSSWAHLELLFCQCGHLTASTRLDKIYGLLGIVRRDASTSTEIVRVQYDVPLLEQLKTISIGLITSLPYMTCFALKLPADFEATAGLPSWAIDPTVEIRGLQPGGLSAVREYPFNAFPSRNEQNTAVDFDGDILHLYGHFCGEVLDIVPGLVKDVLDPGDINDHVHTIILPSEFVFRCLELALQLGPKYRRLDDQPIIEALVRTNTLSIKDADVWVVREVNPHSFWVLVKTVVISLWNLSQSAGKSHAEIGKSRLERLRLVLLAIAEMGITVPGSLIKVSNGISPADDAVCKDLEGSVEEKRMLEVLGTNRPMVNRQIFRTQHDFLGLCADHVVPGDQLWVLCRARVPQILRPLADGTFISLGEAYVHGGVDGELFEQGIAGPLQKIMIV